MTNSLTDEQVSAIVHDSMLAFSKHTDSQRLVTEWSQLSNTQRSEVIRGVRTTIERGVQSPKVAHELWVQAKAESGWSVGEYNRSEKKHPCMVPWERLTPVDQAKDSLYLMLVRTLSSFVLND